MLPAGTDQVAWSVFLLVCLSGTAVSLAKTVEPIDMPFGFRTWMDPRNNVLDGGLNPYMGGGNFGVKGWLIVKYRDTPW